MRTERLVTGIVGIQVLYIHELIGDYVSPNSRSMVLW